MAIAKKKPVAKKTAKKQSKRWIQSAKKSIKRRGTEGSFTAWCVENGYGKKVNARCIAAGLKAGGAIAKKAAMAKAFASSRK
jgi:hypothetical protein